MPVSEQQSTTVVMFRALVMIVCLIAVPLAALCGSSLPAILKAAQEGRLPTLAELKGATANLKNGLADAPHFVSSSYPNNAALPMSMPSDRRFPAAQAALPAAGASWSGPAAVQQPSPVIPARYEAPVDTSRSLERGSTPPVSSGPMPARDLAVQRPASLNVLSGTGEKLIPVNGSNSARAEVALGSLGTPSTASANPEESFSYVQDRLRQLGATYYLLESWGDQKREFRFYCRMAVSGNSQYTRSFWAIDNDPMRAMSQVLQQVETWRADKG